MKRRPKPRSLVLSRTSIRVETQTRMAVRRLVAAMQFQTGQAINQNTAVRAAVEAMLAELERCP